MALIVKPDVASAVEITKEGLAARLRTVIPRAGGKRAVAKKSGVPERTLGHYLAGTAEPPATVLGKIAAVCGVSTDWLVMSLAAELHDAGHGPFLTQSFELVPQLSVQVSAGGGVIVTDEETNGFVAFRSEWLGNLGISAKYARVMMAVGDSMGPTIRDGDLLLVDHSIKTPRSEGIYIVVYQGVVIVKRVQIRRDGTLVLKSDNGKYEDEVVPRIEKDSLQIAGRVRWFGRTI